MNYNLKKTKKGYSLIKVKCKAKPVHHKRHRKVVKTAVAEPKKDMVKIFFVNLPATMGSGLGDVALGEFIKKKR